MKATVIKVLNNSVVLVQKKEKELLVRGKGIAFGLHKGDEFNIPENAKVSYLNTNEHVQSIIDNVSDDILAITETIFDYAQKILKRKLSPLIIVNLADHLDNAINHQKKEISSELNEMIIYETEYLYQSEYRIGLYARELVNEKFHINLPDYEAAFISLHIVNSEIINGTIDNVVEVSEIIKLAVVIIQNNFDIALKKDTPAFSKFVTHLRYLFERQSNSTSEISGTDDIGDNLIETLSFMYPISYETARDIQQMLNEKQGWNLDNNEIVYLIIHIHRLIDNKKEA